MGEAPPVDLDSVHYPHGHPGPVLTYVTACGIRLNPGETVTTVAEISRVTCRRCAWLLEQHEPWTGCLVYTHTDGRRCWHDGTRGWRRYGRDAACPRAHRIYGIETDHPYREEDQALADLAEMLAPPMRDRLRVLLADAVED